MSQEFKSSETRAIFTYSGPVTTSDSPPNEFGTNPLRFEKDMLRCSDTSSTAAAFYPPARGGMKKLDIDLERFGNKIYTTPLWAYSSQSCHGNLTGDSPSGKEVRLRPTPPAQSAQALEPSNMSRLHTIAFVIVTCCAQFLSLSGMFQTVAPMMILANYFDIADYGTLSWFSAAYSLTVGTFILPAGKTHSMPSPRVDGPCISTAYCHLSTPYTIIA